MGSVFYSILLHQKHQGQIKMIRIFVIQRILNFFDFFQQKKVFNFLKKRIKNKSILFDVGAHYGETIKNFEKNFNFDEIHSFEASKKNFTQLEKKFSNRNGIFLNNFGLSDSEKQLLINQFSESSSSTLSKINTDSKYFKRKLKVLGFSEKLNYSEKINVNLKLLDNYFIEKKINKIDLLKIDTEGHEYFVLKGSATTLPEIDYIYFEHHYDDMLKKGYTFSDIHNFLKVNNFKMVFKSKMFFRKTFEYIYKNLSKN